MVARRRLVDGQRIDGHLHDIGVDGVVAADDAVIAIRDFAGRNQRAPERHVFERDAHFIRDVQRLIVERIKDFLMIVAAYFQRQRETHILRADGIHHVVRPAVQADGGHEDDQHHRAENADGRHARAVALHAVRHGGHADEVARLIIVALVPA